MHNLSGRSFLARVVLSSLKTAICEVGNSNTLASTEARLLLDSGSQQSYIMTDLSAQLGLRAVDKEEMLVQTFSSVKPLKLEHCRRPVDDKGR